MAISVKLKDVDRRIQEHPVERRGFVSVPFDYAQPAADPLEIFYRLIPAHGSRHDDATFPVIVVINGGPGVPSHFYRKLDFDYLEPASSKNGSFDRFKFLLKTHRILLIDQRGTAGGSAPIDLDYPSLDAALVARHFSSDNHARDTLTVINAIIPSDESFYMIAQSYGGMPGMQYLTLPDTRLPAGIVFSSSALPYEDVLESMLARRLEQLRLNQMLKVAFPDIEARLARVRAYFTSLRINPDQINGLFAWLGKDVSPLWEKNLIAHLDRLITLSRVEILKEISDGLGDVNLLNYILSSVNFSVGQTDRTLARLGSKRIPYAPWMLDEAWVMMQAGQDGTWRGPFIEAFDRNPPPGTPFPRVEEIRAAITRNQLLFTAADSDAFVPAENYHQSLSKFLVEGHCEVQSLPGGHSAIFLEEGYKTFLRWSAHL